MTKNTDEATPFPTWMLVLVLAGAVAAGVWKGIVATLRRWLRI